MLSRQIVLDLVINELKNTNNLPKVLITAKCPNHNKFCTKPHGDYQILKYENNMFTIRSFGIHGISYSEALFDEPKLRGILEYCLNKHKFKLKYLTKVVDISKNHKNRRMQLFFTDDEWSILTEKAQHKKLTDWARSCLLRQNQLLE